MLSSWTSEQGRESVAGPILGFLFGPGISFPVNPGPSREAASQSGRQIKLYNMSDERENRVKASPPAGLSSALLGNYNTFSQ